MMSCGRAGMRPALTSGPRAWFWALVAIRASDVVNRSPDTPVNHLSRGADVVSPRSVTGKADVSLF